MSRSGPLHIIGALPRGLAVMPFPCARPLTNLQQVLRGNLLHFMAFVLACEVRFKSMSCPLLGNNAMSLFSFREMQCPQEKATSELYPNELNDSGHVVIHYNAHV